MHQLQPLVSIITINYNTPNDICELIRSLKENDYQNIEIIVVDNASKINGPAIISSNFPNVKVIESATNLGFAGGNNLGIEHALGEYIFFMNSDTVITNGTIQTLIQTFIEDSSVGIVSPKFHIYDKPGKFDYAGCGEINSFTGRSLIIGRNQLDSGQFDSPKETVYCHGGGMMTRRDLINVFGQIPDQYFLYYEEMEWCENIRNKGYKVFYQPNALIKHKVSSSIGFLSTLKTYYLTRNRILFMKRNKSMFHQFIFFVYLSFISIPKNILGYIFNGRANHLKYFILAILWNIGYKTTPKF
jgi:hypothetical protein